MTALPIHSQVDLSPFIPRAAETFAGARKLHFHSVKIDRKAAPLLESAGAVVLKVSRPCLTGCLRSFNDVKRHAFARSDQRYPGLVRCLQDFGVDVASIEVVATSFVDVGLTLRC